MPRGKSLSREQLGEIRRRGESGETATCIAAGMNLSQPVVTVRLNQLGIRKRNQFDSDAPTIISRYSAGESGNDLIRDYPMSVQGLYALLRRYGIARRGPSAAKKGRPNIKKRVLTPAQQDAACEMYLSGKSQKDVAAHFNVSADTILKLRKRRGIPMKYVHFPTTHGKHRISYTSKNGREFHFRSTWEKAFAEYLDSKQFEWNYEPAAFDLSNGQRYIPDFQVKSWGVYVEIKGHIWKDAKEKIQMFRAEYPTMPLVVINRRALGLYGISTNHHSKKAIFDGAPAS